jgi:hypothetical protein
MVRKRRRVEMIARMLDRLQAVQPGVIVCPDIVAAPIVTLTFRAHPGGRPLARASMPADGPDGPCPPVSFSVRGHQQTPLLAYPSFLRKVAHVLGVTLR